MRLWLPLLMISTTGVAFGQQADAARDLSLVVGKSLILDSPVPIERVSVANGVVAEALAVTPREVLVNGKAAGETSLIIWQQGGNRLIFDVTITPSLTRVAAVERELKQELGGTDVSLNVDNDTVFLRGTVPDLNSAQRAVAISETLGKTVNLLRVTVPGADQQILLRVRFADVDRTAVQQLGANIFSTGAGNTIGSATTGAFTPPAVSGSAPPTFTLANALNVFLFRPDLNLGATIQALATKQLLQILAEPNVLAINGKAASFLAGGEFPYPTLQGGGGGLGQVTIQYREFGVRLNFLPTMTPRGTIHLQVTPEVSSLDYANALVFQGFTIPALSTRRVQTELELDPGQSFVIGGLLDNRVTETLTKIPGLGDIPLIGKIFHSKNVTRNNSELLVLVTAELVAPIPAGQAAPVIEMPEKFLPESTHAIPRTPGLDVTGPRAAKPPGTMPVEQLIESQKPPQQNAPGMLPYQFVPIPVPATQNPAAAPAPQAAPNPPAPAPAKQP